MILFVVPFVFFFFQAEDGIRDTSVTGVQTCALPIYGSSTGGFSGNSPLSRSTNTELEAIAGALSRKRRATTINRITERNTNATPVARPIRNLTMKPA